MTMYIFNLCFQEFVANHVENMNAFREKLKQRRENLRKQRMDDQEQNSQQQFACPPPSSSQPNQINPTYSNPPPGTGNFSHQYGNQGQWKNDQQRFVGNKPSLTQDQQPGTSQSFSGVSSGFPPFLGQSGASTSSGIPGLGNDDDEEPVSHFIVIKQFLLRFCNTWPF